MAKNVYMTPDEIGERKYKRKKNRMFNAVIYCLSACSILIGVFICLRDQTDLFNHDTAEKPAATFPPVDVYEPSGEPTAGPTARSEEPSKPPPEQSETGEQTSAPVKVTGSEPVAIYFYDHDISVKVVPVGINKKGEMETIPKHDIAGWYKNGPAPNQDGNCIIAGHNRYSGQKGLFALLHKGLKLGDRICVTLKNGEVKFYCVESIDRYKYNRVPESVMAEDGPRRLTLITCLGDYNYDLQMSETRVVAVCRPIN